MSVVARLLVVALVVSSFGASAEAADLATPHHRHHRRARLDAPAPVGYAYGGYGNGPGPGWIASDGPGYGPGYAPGYGYIAAGAAPTIFDLGF